MNDLTPSGVEVNSTDREVEEHLSAERLTQWREDAEVFQLHGSGSLETARILVLIDALESARAERSTLYTSEQVGEFQASEAELVARPLRAENVRLRAKLRDMEIERNMLRITTEALTAKVARVEKLAEEWKRLPGGVVIDAQAEVTDPFTAALADDSPVSLHGTGSGLEEQATEGGDDGSQ